MAMGDLTAVSKATLEQSNYLRYLMERAGLTVAGSQKKQKQKPFKREKNSFLNFQIFFSDSSGFSASHALLFSSKNALGTCFGRKRNFEF